MSKNSKLFLVGYVWYEKEKERERYIKQTHTHTSAHNNRKRFQLYRGCQKDQDRGGEAKGTFS